MNNIKKYNTSHSPTKTIIPTRKKNLQPQIFQKNQKPHHQKTNLQQPPTTTHHDFPSGTTRSVTMSTVSILHQFSMRPVFGAGWSCPRPAPSRGLSRKILTPNPSIQCPSRKINTILCC